MELTFTNLVVRYGLVEACRRISAAILLINTRRTDLIGKPVHREWQAAERAMLSHFRFMN